MFAPFVTHGQKKTKIDGDKLHLGDSLGGKIIFVTSIERGDKHADAKWITYQKRPGIDPWIKDENFTTYWADNGIRILGIFEEIYLIHFKVSEADWTKMRELYADFESYVRKIN
jgi:hypothetical protein